MVNGDIEKKIASQSNRHYRDDRAIIEHNTIHNNKYIQVYK